LSASREDFAIFPAVKSLDSFTPRDVVGAGAYGLVRDGGDAAPAVRRRDPAGHPLLREVEALFDGSQHQIVDHPRTGPDLPGTKHCELPQRRTG
jgi:hypothetical protein